ncbi:MULTISPECIES: hypothetical protein [unclassified Pseudoclavibacter]|uniref:hypothetical protein n=1 Tax=unclassified Pseudoclavibacter TaxID=2615177 RepID=UPI001BADB3CF|nr:hypothetical protein [Pseudoclavibacter sp. Marseille-Q4354]MBS3177730.1 hypothetical protein [Pseudoclavibacter sp. Marseille-Q4354]
MVTPLATVALVFSEDELLEFARYFEGLPALMRPDQETPAGDAADRLVAAARELIHASRASRRAVRR